MKYFAKVTSRPPTWVRGSIIGSISQLSVDAGSRPLFSDPLDEDVYDTRFDQRQIEYMNVREAIPQDKSIGGVDA
jgi:hypothetical protein